MLKVVDNNGRAIPEAQLWLWVNYRGLFASEHVQSDSQGHASIRFARVPVDVTAVAGAHASTLIQSVELPTDEPYVIKLDEGSKIVGRVINEKKMPVAGMEITAEKKVPYHDRPGFILSGTTDKDGNFVLNNASEGRWNISR